MIRYDHSVAVRGEDKSMFMETYKDAKSPAGQTKVIDFPVNIRETYCMVLTNGKNLFVTLDQVVLTSKGPKTIFELMGANKVKTRVSFTLIGPKGLKPRTKEIYLSDKSAVYDVLLSEDNYFEVNGVLLKGKTIEECQTGKK